MPLVRTFCPDTASKRARGLDRHGSDLWPDGRPMSLLSPKNSLRLLCVRKRTSRCTNQQEAEN